MSVWLIVLMVVGYLVVGSVAARVTAWLTKERVIFVPRGDLEVTLVAVLFLWPVMVLGWLLVRLICFLAFPARLR
jgi:hypothetical protein